MIFDNFDELINEFYDNADKFISNQTRYQQGYDNGYNEGFENGFSAGISFEKKEIKRLKNEKM